MSRPLRFRPQARAEFDEVADEYERRADGLGVDFVARVQVVLDRIAASPEQVRIVFKDIRRINVRRFPYAVYYRIDPAEIVILAVIHVRRSPETWKSRS